MKKVTLMLLCAAVGSDTIAATITNATIAETAGERGRTFVCTFNDGTKDRNELMSAHNFSTFDQATKNDILAQYTKDYTNKQADGDAAVFSLNYAPMCNKGRHMFVDGNITTAAACNLLKKEGRIPDNHRLIEIRSPNKDDYPESKAGCQKS